MTQQAVETDPFAGGGGDKIPSLSFNNCAVGTTYHFTVTARPEELQTKNFETGELEFWPEGKKKVAAVLTVTVDELGGEERSIWARKPSAMFRALQEASQKAGVPWGPGVRGTLTFTGEKPNEKNPRLNPQKQYAATCQAGDPFAPQLPQPPANVWSAPAPAQAGLPQQVAQPAVQPATAAALGNLSPELIQQILAAQAAAQSHQPAPQSLQPPF